MPRSARLKFVSVSTIQQFAVKIKNIRDDRESEIKKTHPRTQVRIVQQHQQKRHDRCAFNALVPSEVVVLDHVVQPDQ